MKVHVLASGSKGNAALFEAGNTRLLVDAGLSPRALEKRLRVAGASGPPTAVLITHAHADHVGYCARVANAYGATLYMTEATSRVAAPSNVVDRRTIGAREPFVVGSLTLSPRPVPHDAAQIALVVSDGDHRVGLATDLGEVPAGLIEHFDACDAWLLESNHEPDLLRDGPYPEFLKRRIASSRGHLSNHQTAELLRALPLRTQAVVLMHLSETNNRPKVALDVARDALSRRPEVTLRAASQHEVLSLDVAELRARRLHSPESTLAARRRGARAGTRSPADLSAATSSEESSNQAQLSLRF